MRKKILYIMHIDWNWIQQRPHYLAKNLSKFYDVLVSYSFCKNRSLLTKNKKDNLKLIPFFTIPLRRELKILYFINNLCLKIYFYFIIKIYRPDYIWITFPELYNYIPVKCKSKIIYDCMDDVISFNEGHKFNQELIKLERNLIYRSHYVFVSSFNLINKLKNRYGLYNKMILIRNAFGGDILDIKKNSNIDSNIIKIGYVGTISSWFDFEALSYLIEKITNIEFHLIGPVDKDIDIKIFENDKIKFYGPVDHNRLFEYVNSFNCMIMPFKISNLILSVDPVKLYEYINYNKPIVSIYYEEIKRFAPFVSFYKNKEELYREIIEMINNGFSKKYSDEQRNNFLRNNTWNARVEEIISYLEKL